ncbi:MAG: hypothetical protein H6Q89_1050 [Myxococcaceae bacterium]|nr:hypothetical protein [Myxococcaceae bacterium]
MFLTRALVLLALIPTAAWAQRETTRDALDRLEETLAIRQEDGSGLVIKDLLPAIVVSVTPAYDETKNWFPTAALASLVRIFGAPGLRSCEACRAPRLYMEDGKIEHNTSNLGTVEITRLDESVRGKGAAARTAIWLDETAEGVSLKLIDLRNSRIVMAESFDPSLSEAARTRQNLKLARELDRRARGDAVTHAFVDVTGGNGFHLSFDWTEQWGDANTNLSGFTISLVDPLVGLGGSYYRVLPFAWNLMVGVKLLVSVPTGLVRAISPTAGNVIDPLFTGLLVVRLPFGKSNFGLVATVSTNGKVGIGLSLLNISLLPFLP